MEQVNVEKVVRYFKRHELTLGLSRLGVIKWWNGKTKKEFDKQAERTVQILDVSNREFNKGFRQYFGISRADLNHKNAKV